MTYETCEVWLVVDAAGDYAIGKTADEARESYEETIQSFDQCDGFTLRKLVLKVPLQEVPAHTATLPESQSGPVALTVEA